jgi:hypothetical protein
MYEFLHRQGHDPSFGAVGLNVRFARERTSICALAMHKCHNRHGLAVSNRSKAALFDHLVGAREKRRRDFEAEHPGRLSVEDELELTRLHDGSGLAPGSRRALGGRWSTALTDDVLCLPSQRESYRIEFLGTTTWCPAHAAA